jgi:hypothetical protein
MPAAIKPIEPIKQAIHHGLIWLTIYYRRAWFGRTKLSQAYQAQRLIAACLLASLELCTYRREGRDRTSSISIFWSHNPSLLRTSPLRKIEYPGSTLQYHPVSGVLRLSIEH